MMIVHLTSSTFHGGPERQMLGLATSLASGYRSGFVSFPENGLCTAFLQRASAAGFAARALTHDTPRLWGALSDLLARLRAWRASILCTHGYKADVVGWLAARRLGLPIVAVSRGWTGEDRKIRLYEAWDRRQLRWMDRVVCVSDGQAEKVRRAGVPEHKIATIRNAIRMDRFRDPHPEARALLQGYFPSPRRCIVGSAGRLSPEKGFGNLVEAVAAIRRAAPDAGFVHFGDGPLRADLVQRIQALGLQEHFVLAGFRDDLDRLLPGLDLMVLPSYTEGLPNVVLEAFAAGVAVVATAVGGTPEVVENGVSGYLVPAGDVPALATRIQQMLDADERRKAMGAHGRDSVQRRFTFAAQARQYEDLFAELTQQHLRPRSSPWGALGAWVGARSATMKPR